MKGRTGPPKTPTRLAALRGNPGKRPVNQQEPKPRPASDDCPTWIADDPVARETWDELAPELVRLGLLTALDRQALAGGCRWWSVYRRADAALSGTLTAETRSNGETARPEVAIALKAFSAAMTIFGRFGVTPSERTRLVSPEPDAPDDPLERLLREREQAKRPA